VTIGERSAADIAEQPDVLARVVRRNELTLRRASSLIASARLVRFAGLGSSKHAAGYGARALDVTKGIPAAVLPAPGAGVSLPALRRDEPLVILSQSGRTPALVYLAQCARDAGVSVIAITNEPASALEKIATVTLACDAGTEHVVAATKSVSAQMLLVRALAVRPVDLGVDTLVDAVTKTLEIDVTPALGKHPPRGIVCAGFAAEWIADEIALKFAETVGLPATSESVVEHFHGPRATETSVLAFLDPTDPNSVELATLDHVTTVGPHESYHVVTPATGDPTLDAIVTLIAGQRIVRAWALHLGEDPDADRGLSKVTQTR
jgi:glucosamine--fructose-6-phosphate aminotransferase (isomerizing)